MVDPQWRSLRPPKQVFTNLTNVYNRYDVNQNCPKYVKRGFEGYVDYNDIFKEDSVVEMHFPKHFMGDRWLHYNSNKDQHLSAPIEPINTYPCLIENQSSYQDVRHSPTNLLTSNCYNEENDIKPILVPTQGTSECVDIRDPQPLQGSMSSLATNTVGCEINTADSLSSHIDNDLSERRNLTEAQRKALKKKRKRLNQRRNRRDKGHAYIQCRVSRRLLQEIISSSITVNGTRVCL